MTKEDKALFDKVRIRTDDAKRLIAQAEDKLAEAAEECRGTPMEDRLNSHYDALEDLRFDLNKQVNEFRARLNGEGNEAPESWRDAG